MSPRAVRSRRQAARQWQKAFIDAMLDYRQRLTDKLGAAADEPARARTLTALVLKAGFLKLAHEKRLLNVDSAALFADLMKLKRRRPKTAAQLDLFAADRSRTAIDNLLEDLELDSAVVAKASLGELYATLMGFRLDFFERDLLGALYQALASEGGRKRRGQYYTPPAIVNAILDALPLDPVADPELTILDPACGSGQFLLGAYARLKARLTAAGMPPAEAHRRILERHVNGYDLDSFALTLAKMNLVLEERVGEPIAFRIHGVNPLKRADHLLFCEAVERAAPPGRFDIVIGNPPWGSELSASEKAEFRRAYVSAQSGVNPFTLFIERALELVRPGGSIGLLVPEAYLNIRAHRASRRLLLDRAAIVKLVPCGELFDGVFAPAAILVARVEPDAAARRANRVQVAVWSGGESAARGDVPQAAFEDTPENIFNVHLEGDVRRLLSQIAHGAATLKDRAKFGLGLVTGDNERLVAPRKLGTQWEPLIVGRDVERFRINFSGRHVVYDREALQQACPREIFDAPEKLVYRFIGKRLVFARDDRGRFTLNNANVLVPQLPGFRARYLLALLNSSVVQFYYTYSFFTVKVLRGNIERLPLRWTSEARQTAIDAQVAALDALDGDAFGRAVAALDEDVFDIYGVAPADRAFIRARLAAELGEDEGEDAAPPLASPFGQADAGA
ncbi:MAG: hypothetical protein C4523_16575 [Myxococcales bacterium]|nr:MAG: hypothetical protein C4523_16575 [Myxococcales bacterium]